jgi:hypothetical protein
MAQQLSGVAAWMSSIRTSMAKDPCRQLFEDQVQTHGFIFLEDYLENILDGPKQEYVKLDYPYFQNLNICRPIIELVKTPARKKTAPKRTRAATSAAAKMRSVIALSNIDEGELQGDVFSVAGKSGDNRDRAGEALKVENTMSSSRNALHSDPPHHQSQKPTRAKNIPNGNYTQPLPQVSQPTSPVTYSGDALTTPPPVLPASDDAPASTIMEVPLNDSPSRTLALKSSVLHFPTLPAPSPLRKSMRVTREPSMGAEILAPVPAPAPPPALGKRTSWLMKAREVKAMEGVAPSRTSPPDSGLGSIPASVHIVVPSNGVKRKSGDMLAAAPDEGRRAKVAKASESAPEDSNDPLSLKQEVAMPPQAPPFVLGLTRVDEEHLEPLNDEEDEDEASFMGMFKRTVEGLGARAGKSMGKSLGGGAATAALAEARAAAEARVAERNKVPGEEITESEDRSGASAEGPQLTAEHDRQSERRLSLSDITPTNENPVVIQSSSTALQSLADESVSTTPPNSPPPTRISGSRLVPPPGPVFNRQPPPVFVPPASKQPAPPAEQLSFNLPKATFTLPPPISLGLPARLASPPSSLRPPPQTGSSQQSSQTSAFSDAIFDQVDDIPAWTPSTQDTEYTDGAESQNHEVKQAALEDDDDDSWPLDEKLAAGEQGWTPFNFNNKDDSTMTWATLPTESQGHTRTGTNSTGNPATKAAQKDEGPVIPNAFAMEIDSEADQVQDNASCIPEEEAGDESVMYTSDLRDVLKAGESTVNLVEVCGLIITSIHSIDSDNQSQVEFNGATASYPSLRRLRPLSSHKQGSSLVLQSLLIVCLAQVRRPSQS